MTNNTGSDNDIQFGDFDTPPSGTPATPSKTEKGLSQELGADYLDLLNEADTPRAPLESDDHRNADVDNHDASASDFRTPPPLMADPQVVGGTRRPITATEESPPPRAGSRNETVPKIAAVVALLVLVGVGGYVALGGSDATSPPAVTELSGGFGAGSGVMDDQNDFYANLPGAVDLDDASAEPLIDVDEVGSGPQMDSPFEMDVDPTAGQQPEPSPAIGGVASAAIGSLVAQAEAMVAALETRLVARIEAIENRVARREAGEETLAAKVAALESQVMQMGSRRAAAPAPARQASATNASGTVFDRYTITTPNGVLTQAQLFFGPASRRQPQASEIRLQKGRSDSGSHFVSVEIPDSMVNVLPPRGAGVVTLARTALHPTYRRFTYFAPVPIEGHVQVTDTAVDILMAPVGNSEFAMAKARREGRLLAPAPEANAIRTALPASVPVAGVRLGPDGRVVHVEEMNSRSVAASQRVTGGDGPYSPPPLGRMAESRPIAVVPPFYGDLAASPPQMQDDRVVPAWDISAMTSRLAILVNLQTGQRLSVMVDTYIDGVGRVTAIDTGRRLVFTESGVIRAS